MAMNLLTSMPPMYIVISVVISLLIAVLSVAYLIFKQPLKVKTPRTQASDVGADADCADGNERRGTGDGEIDAPSHSDTDGDADGGPHQSVRDPVAYCEHIQSEMKKTHQRLAQRHLEEGMTAEQHANEREVQKQQLAAIYKLMGGPNGDFGISTIDDIQQQMQIYK